MPNTPYKVRNRLLEVVGQYTEPELLARITAGKFTGEEEIAHPPYERWQKLASHPAFYDAFLKRLYAEDYHAPPGVDVSRPKASIPENPEDNGKTRRNEAHSQEERNLAEGKTHQNIGGGEPGHTIHQSEIDALFSQADDAPESGTQVRAAGKTDLIIVPAHAEPQGSTPDFSVPLDPAPPPPATLRPTDQAKRKKLKIYAAVAAVLVALYLFSGGDPNPGMISDKVAGDSGPSLGSSATPEERALTLGEEAAALMVQDSLLFYRGAHDVLKEALGIDEKNPILLGRLAITLARLATNPQEAERLRPQLEQVVVRARVADPHSSELYRAEAILAQAADKVEDAKNFALKAAESDPVAAENLLLIGELHYSAGNLAEARNVLAEAVKADPTRVRARYFLALAAWDMGDVNAAQADGLEALRLNPLHPKTYLLLAEVASRRNQIKEARGLYETCGKLARFTTPEVPTRAYLRLGELHELAGNTGEAQSSYLLAYHYSKKSDEIKPKVKGLDISDAALKAAAAQAEYHAGYFTEQGTGLMGQGKTEEAVRFFQAAHLLDPKNGLALIQLGEVMEKTASSYEDFRRVMSYYQRAIDRDPTEAMGYIKLGMLESEQYNFERGLKLLMQAVALAPESEKPYVALGKHYYKRQDYSEALNQFLKAAKINPSDSEILYYAGKLRLVYKKDGAREAQGFFNQAYTLDPRNYDALAEWLKLKVTGYEKNFAVKFVNNLIASEPANPMNYWVLGEVYAESKEFRRAVTLYHKALDLDNRQSKVRMSLAKALEAVGELDKAVAEFRLSSLLDRRNSEGFYRAADLLFQMKSYAQSEEVLKFLMGVTPNYPGVHRYLSKIHQLREQKDAAIEQMRQEVANNPANYKFVLELAELYIDYEKYDEAISALKDITTLPSTSQAPEYKTEKIRAYLLLSRCYRAKKQPESGESAIRLALSLDPNDPELHRELGYVYYALQRDKEGVKEFEYYLERSPAARDTAVIKGLIKKMIIEE